MRFAQLARLHGPRYRHTVLSLDGNTDMASRLGGLPVTCQTLSFDKSRLLGSLRQFRKALEAIKPDGLLTYNWGAIEWALVNRMGRSIPHLHVEDGFGPEEAQKQLRRRIWMRRMALSGRQTQVVLPSRNLERIALSLWRLPPARVRFIPNGIDLTRFAVPRENREGETVIGTVASLRREKNLPRLLRAFARLGEGRSGLKLMVVGDGAERPVLERLAGELGVAASVRFVGQTSRPEEWLARMDIFALSSDTEQMPLSLLEAMAAGLPAVATRVGDVPQLVAAENGPYVVALEDDAFLEALARLVDDAAARRLIGDANAQKARENFDEATMAARYAALIG